MRFLRNRVVACLGGAATAFLWHYINAQVLGYLALWRFPDHWAPWARVGVPTLFFLCVVVVPSYYLLIRVFGKTSTAAIWSSCLTYAALMVYAHTEIAAQGLELLSSALLVFMTVLAGFVALRVARSVKSLPEPERSTST